MPDQIQLSHLEQTAYFAALRQGMHVLDVERMSDLMAVSPTHAAKLLATMARKGALQRVGRGRYVIVSSDVLYGRQTFVADPRVYPLDPHGPAAGSVHPRWHVRENLTLELGG